MLNCRARSTLQVQGVVVREGIESSMCSGREADYHSPIFLLSRPFAPPPTLLFSLSSPPLRAVLIRAEGGRAAAEAEGGVSLNHLSSGKQNSSSSTIPVRFGPLMTLLSVCRLQWTLLTFMTLQDVCRRKESLL